MRRILWCVSVASASIILLAAAVATAAEYPTRNLKLIVPVPPGGPLDLTARLLADGLSERLKQPVVVENKPGGGSLIGARAVASAEPDGYTLLIGTPSIATFKLFLKNPQFDVQRDLEPIGMVVSFPYVLAVTARRDIKSVPDLVSFAKANPDKLNVATYGNASQLIIGIFNNAAQIKATRVPFTGSAPAHTALMAGDIDYILTDAGTLRPLLSTGNVRILAVAGAARMPDLPDVPTLRETGLDVPELTVWYGLWAPAKTPSSIVDQLSHAMTETMSAPHVVSKLSGLGIYPAPTSAQVFKEKLGQEQAADDNVAKQIGLVPE